MFVDKNNKKNNNNDNNKTYHLMMYRTQMAEILANIILPTYPVFGKFLLTQIQVSERGYYHHGALVKWMVLQKACCCLSLVSLPFVYLCFFRPLVHSLVKSTVLKSLVLKVQLTQLLKELRFGNVNNECSIQVCCFIIIKS